MEWLLIFISFSILFFLSKVKLQVIKRSQKSGFMKIEFLYFFTKKIDMTKKMETYIKEQPFNVILKNIASQINFLKQELHLKNFLKHVVVKKLIFIPRSNDSFHIYKQITNWMIIAFLKRVVDETFKKTKYEYYQIYLNDDSKKGFDLEIILEVRLIYLFYTILKNLKTISKIKKGEKYARN